MYFTDVLDFAYVEEEQDLFITSDNEVICDEECEDEVEMEEYEVVPEDIVRLYLQQIGEFPLCTPQEELEYFDRIRQGDEAAKKEFADRNLRLVVSIAKRYVSSRSEFLDNIQNGNLGLLRAIEKFDETKGYKFSTYATWWIRQAITRAIPEQHATIRIPVHLNEDMNKYRRLMREYENEGKVLSLEEATKALSWKEEKVRTVQKLLLDIVSLNTNVGEDKETPLMDFIASEDESIESIVEFKDSNERVKEIIEQCLRPREIKVLYMRNGLYSGKKMTLAEVGELLNLTRERIRQIEKKALEKLKKNRLIKEFKG